MPEFDASLNHLIPKNSPRYCRAVVILEFFGTNDAAEVDLECQVSL